MRLHDMGQFHHLLKQLGVNISGRSFQGAAPFGLEEITKFVESVGNEDFTPPADLDAMLPPQADIAWEYDTCPSETEVLAALGKMRDTKGGKDGITVGCIRAMGPWYQRQVAKAIQQLWQSPPDSWDATLHDVVGVLLFKKGSRADLANYRSSTSLAGYLPKLLMAESSVSLNSAVCSQISSMVFDGIDLPSAP